MKSIGTINQDFVRISLAATIGQATFAAQFEQRACRAFP
jgi:hypothetical protein